MHLVGVSYLLSNNTQQLFFNPDIADSLRSSNPVEFAKGVFKAMVPMPKEKRPSSDGLKFFRESPFNIIYIGLLKNEAKGTGGLKVQSSAMHSGW